MHAVELNYDTFGDKQNPAVLLVMGLTSQKVRFPTGFCQRLASEGFFVIRFDNRDVGRSARTVKSRLHRFGVVGQLLWCGALRILKEWGKPLFAIWLVFFLRAWRRRGALRGHEASRWAARLIVLLIASVYRPSVPYSVADLAGDALELLDALQIRKVHLVGYSMGGMVSQFIAHHNPDRLSSLSLVSTCSPHARLMVTPGLWPILRIVIASGLTYIPGVPAHWRVDGTRNLWMYISAPGQHEAQHELALQEHARASQDLDAFFRQALCILDFCGGDGHWAPSDPKTSSIRTIVMHGLMDNLLPVSHGFDLARLKSCKCIVLPSISHDSFPAGQDDVLEELKFHLRKLG